MPSGGHARSGPVPDPNALRRDRDKAEWTHLPVAGRQGEAPVWPLGHPTKRELGLWEQEWRRPQAIIWDARGLQLQVGLYVRAVVVSEGKLAKAADRMVVLRYMDDLGLTQGGLARNRWIIDAEPAPKAMRPTGTEAPSARDRFTVVDGGG